MSKENRGEGQKMDHKRIWVTQPQLQSRHELCLGEGAVDTFLPSQPKETWINAFSQPGLGSVSCPRQNKRCWLQQTLLVERK